MGVRAETINSSNTADWDNVIDRIRANEVDLLLVSPERLSNVAFRESVLDRLGRAAGLLVVDEAHCISDWGHDFRPDYRRIRRLLDVLPPTVPVLACTATANDRVVEDVIAQLGDDLQVFRGPLARPGLALHVIDLQSPAARMAWLAQTLPNLPGPGIVYCLTKRDAEAVAEWLNGHGMRAISYTGASDGREEIELALMGNEIEAVVATSALGMGFDKPDLAYVIHFQSPGSVISYYQQVGRAGRQLERSVGVLLRGSEDTDIQDWFITTAFPTSAEYEQVLDALENHDGFMKLTELEAAVNVQPTRIESLMKNLEVDGIIVADGKKYQRTPRPFSYDIDRIEAITALRRKEQEEMLHYGTLTAGCRMVFLGNALDDLGPSPCGICDLCSGPSLLSTTDQALAREAAEFLRRRPVVIAPRKKWPDQKNIPIDNRIEEGRALCRWGDGGWSVLVKQGKQIDGRFDPQLVAAVAALVRGWAPNPAPRWVTWVPSQTHPDLVPDFAKRLGDELGLQAVEAVTKIRHTNPQKTMQNSAQQFANLRGAFSVVDQMPRGSMLLVDDIVDSRWTMTYVGHLLRKAGCDTVLPLALADSGQS